MKKTIKIINKQTKKPLHKYDDYKQQKKQVLDLLNQYKLPCTIKNPLDFFRLQIIAKGIQQKEIIEDCFYLSQNKMQDYFFTLDYKEKQRLLQVDVHACLQALSYVSFSTYKSYIPFFNQEDNMMYQNDTLMLDMKKYQGYIRDFGVYMQKMEDYEDSFFNSEFCSATLCFLDGKKKGLYCNIDQCLYFVKDNKIDGFLSIDRTLTMSQKETICELYFQDHPQELVEDLKQHHILQEKTMHALEKHFAKVSK